MGAALIQKFARNETCSLYRRVLDCFLNHRIGGFARNPDSETPGALFKKPRLECGTVVEGKGTGFHRQHVNARSDLYVNVAKKSPIRASDDAHWRSLHPRDEKT